MSSSQAAASIMMNILQRLPAELLQSILSRLTKKDLTSLNLCSQWFYQTATPHIWRDLELVDCRNGEDDHDDTPLLKKLLVLVQKPWIAREVVSLTHRCHLSPPGIFSELPSMPFSSCTLSCDVRTVELVKMAVKNMRNVQTVRIIFGHPILTDAILRCVFDKKRERVLALRRLWLENCRIGPGLIGKVEYGGKDLLSLPEELDFCGLESVRMRRLPMRPAVEIDKTKAVGRLIAYSRDGHEHELQDGLGGLYKTTCSDASMEMIVAEDYAQWLATSGSELWSPHETNTKNPLEALYNKSHDFDDRIYEALNSAVKLPHKIVALGSLTRRQRADLAYRGNWINRDEPKTPDEPLWLGMQRQKISSADLTINMFKITSATLTSLNLDWILNVPQFPGEPPMKAIKDWIYFYADLFNCRFPHLRAFQLRNFVVPDATIPPDVSLLGCFADPLSRKHPIFRIAGLEFMEAHPNLECLAWPMDHFFSPQGSAPDLTSRVAAVIENLGRTLVDLRVDTSFRSYGEPHTEEHECHDPATRSRRRLFITQFASKMRNLKSIKIEGGMPRDERREIIRALHACALEKVVIIGVSSPLGNTWGTNGEDVSDLIDNPQRIALEGEDRSTVHSLGPRTPEPPPENFLYQPQYGWNSMSPMLSTISSFHANTVRELKFCGYRGSAIIFSPTAITTPLLSPLKYFHNLKSIILSMWLVTTFEGSNRDYEIINFWSSSRNPSSTALVRTITDEEPENLWEKELRTKFAPDALAWRITNFLGPFLSEEAKGRKGGVHVRASFCVGEFGGIFDLDLRIGKGGLGSDVCLGFVGPREELEEERRRGKLEGRRWF